MNSSGLAPRARDQHRESSRHEHAQRDARRGAAESAPGYIGTAIRLGIHQMRTTELPAGNYVLVTSAAGTVQRTNVVVR